MALTLDPTEAQTLQRAMSEGRSGDPLLLVFGERRVIPLGDEGESWFLSQTYESNLWHFDHDGALKACLPCPPVDRAVQAGDQVLGVRTSAFLDKAEPPSHGALAFDARTGNVVWKMPGKVVAPATGRIGLRAKSGASDQYEAFDFTTGAALSTFVGISPQECLAEQHLYVTLPGPRFAALDVAAGRELWRASAPSSVQAILPGPLVAQRRGLWFVGTGERNAVLVCLSRETGTVVAEHKFKGHPTGLQAVGDRLLVAHTRGVRMLDGATWTDLVKTAEAPSVISDGTGYVILEKDGKNLTWGAELGGPMFRATLAEPWKLVAAARGLVTLQTSTRILRWPLALVGHQKALQATRIGVKADRTLTAPEGFIIGKVKLDSDQTVAAAFKKLTTALAAGGLMPRMSGKALKELLEELQLPDDADEIVTSTSLAATVLELIHEGEGTKFGLVMNDHRFDADVIEQYAKCLAGEPLKLEPLSRTGSTMRVAVTIDGVRTEEEFSLEAGLLDVTLFVNRKLKQAGSARRFHDLDTGGDSFVIVCRTDDEVAALKAAGVRGFE